MKRHTEMPPGHHFDVIIAGAGPVGLFLACELGLAGVSVLVLERGASAASPWKAPGLGMRALNTVRIRRSGTPSAPPCSSGRALKSPRCSLTPTAPRSGSSSRDCFRPTTVRAQSSRAFGACHSATISATSILSSA